MSVNLWSVVENVPADAGESEFATSWGAIASLVGDRSGSGEMAMLEVMRDAGTLQAGAIDPAWGGGWQWNMSSGAAKSVLASALLYGVLVAAGVPGLLPIVVPTVIPLLFEVEKVRLSRAEKNVIGIIGARKDAFDRRGNTRELYASLPDDVRQSVSEREFGEFIDAAIRAGVASEEGDIVEVLETGESVFRLHVS